MILLARDRARRRDDRLAAGMTGARCEVCRAGSGSFCNPHAPGSGYIVVSAPGTRPLVIHPDRMSRAVRSGAVSKRELARRMGAAPVPA